MPKMTKVFGPERTNLMYALIGHLLIVGVATTEELAERFGYTKAEITDAVKSIGLTDAGREVGYFGAPFEVDYDALEEDGVVAIRNHADVLVTPRLTTKQTAAICAGLTVLSQIPGFEHQDEVNNLLDALQGDAYGAVAPFEDEAEDEEPASDDEGPDGPDSEGPEADQINPDESAPPTRAIEVATFAVSAGQADPDLLTIREAILTDVAIRCDYRNGKGETTKARLISPLRLESRDETWYLRGYCHKHNEVRVFKLDSMDSVELTETKIEPEHKALQLDDELFRPGADAISVLIDVSPEGYEVLDAYRANFKAGQSGVIRAEIKVSSLKTLGPMVASFGGAVKVVSPAEARKEVHDFALLALGRGSEISEPGLE